MKSQAKIWIAALCLLLAAVVFASLRTRSTGVLAAQHSMQVSQPALQQPAAYLSNASLRAAAASNAMMLDASGAGRLSMAPQSNLVLPQVEEFTLTPPNPARQIDKTVVSVRFPELAVDKLDSQLPITLGNQNVILQRSADDSRVFSTQVDFDWQQFIKEQQQRKDLANKGKMIPVFAGRRVVSMDKVEFVDPADILIALQSHQPIQFSAKILEGTGFTIQPDHELMITNLAVVTDTSRTWDSCSSSGTAMGAWTFGKLVTEMTGTFGNQVQADAMVQVWLNQWLNDQTINGFTVAKRTNMANIISAWPKDTTIAHNVDVSKAPLQLNAIVNRIDLGAGSPPKGGEVRFVFGFCSTTEAIPFNVILEYGVPASVASGCTGVQTWAGEWHHLGTMAVGTTGFNNALQAITDQVVAAGADSTKPFGSALDQVRTNETALKLSIADWEQRQFQLIAGGGGSPTLKEGTLSQTPDSQNSAGDFNGANSPPGGNAFVLSDYINFFQPDIISGTYTVPATWTDPTHTFSGNFLGASAFNTGTAPQPGYWNGCSPAGTVNCAAIASNLARSDFSLNTCNGCHGRETANDASFQQVLNRETGSLLPSGLSGFLLGCSSDNGGLGLTGNCPPTDLFPLTAPGQEIVQDPVITSTLNTFGDLLNRQTYMSNLLGSCTADQILQSFVRHKTTFVH